MHKMHRRKLSAHHVPITLYTPPVGQRSVVMCPFYNTLTSPGNCIYSHSTQLKEFLAYNRILRVSAYPFHSKKVDLQYQKMILI